MNIDAEGILHLTTDSFVGKSAALLGITGSGKTNSAAVLIEELLSNGLPMTIVDIEGEYYGIKQMHTVLVAGRSEHAELLLNPENAGALATASIERGISVILDLSEYTEEESYTCLVEYFTALWNTASKVKRPYQIVLEEAHEFLPEGTRTPLKALLTRIALRGRKRGLSIVLMSQRSAKVAKDVLTQTSLLFLHKVVHPIDMKVYKDLIPLPGAEVERLVGALQPGQAIVVSNHTPQTVQIRLRHTFHAGSTPVLGEQALPELRKIDATLLHELEQMIATSSPVAKDGRRLEKRMAELEALLTEKDAEIAKRDEQIALLSKLSVTMNGTGGDAVQLPETMQITRASIDTATVHQVNASLSSSPVVEAAIPKQIATQAAVVPINEAKMRSLQQRLLQLSSHQYRVVKLLVEHDTPMTVEEIAAWLGVARSTAQSYLPPDALFKLGLVKRFRSGNAYVYKSTLKDHLAKEFSGVDQEALLRRLLGK